MARCGTEKRHHPDVFCTAILNAQPMGFYHPAQLVRDARQHGVEIRPIDANASERDCTLSFLRDELYGAGIAPCTALRTAQNGNRITVSGLVLVRQMPGSAKGVMFVTLEDETDIANLIIWPSLFDKQRKIILGAQIMACRGKVQSVSGVIHVVAEYLIDQTELLNGVGGKDEAFMLPAGRGDEAKHGGSGLDSREPKLPTIRPRDIYVPDMHIDTLKVKARNFR
jgi:error-prone DNA polymerase